MSKNTHTSLSCCLKHTASVRLSHDRLTSRGGAGVGSSVAFRHVRSATIVERHFELSLTLLDLVLTPFAEFFIFADYKQNTCLEHLNTWKCMGQSSQLQTGRCS